MVVMVLTPRACRARQVPPQEDARNTSPKLRSFSSSFRRTTTLYLDPEPSQQSSLLFLDCWGAQR